jgi:hypothetical protein
MDVQPGDRVRVNVAPFIGSLRRSKQSVICEVLDAEGEEVEVRTLPPCREFTLRIGRLWIEHSREPVSV